MAKAWDNLSRAVSHALRHEPWLYELEFDEGGWAVGRRKAPAPLILVVRAKEACDTALYCK